VVIGAEEAHIGLQVAIEPDQRAELSVVVKLVAVIQVGARSIVPENAAGGVEIEDEAARADAPQAAETEDSLRIVSLSEEVTLLSNLCRREFFPVGQPSLFVLRARPEGDMEHRSGALVTEADLALDAPSVEGGIEEEGVLVDTARQDEPVTYGSLELHSDIERIARGGLHGLR
jgi:hypothetical protein